MALCHKPPAQNLIALRPSNYVCSCCQNGNWGTKAKVKVKERHASSARTVGTGVPPLRVETAPPYPTPVLLQASRCLHPKRAGALLGS